MSTPVIKRVLVTGATSQIGDFLLPLLVNEGMEVHALTRNVPDNASSPVRWHQGDIDEGYAPGEYDAIIHLAYLPLLPVLLEKVRPGTGLTRVIGFSSTSRFTKQASADTKEQNVVRELGDAEEAVKQWCQSNAVAWTIFRPTLIYGRGRDGNVTTISRFIRRFHVFPLVGNGKALRQPVHAQDLAQAVVLALHAPASHDKAYNLSGGETLSYRNMVARIFTALGRKPHFIPVPLLLLRILIPILRIVPSYRHLSMEMATRMQNDLCFSHEDASKDFGYAPGPFRPQA